MLKPYQQRSQGLGKGGTLAPRKCRYCAKSFQPKRNHAVFCHPSCRKFAFLERKEDKLREQIRQELLNKLALKEQRA